MKLKKEFLHFLLKIRYVRYLGIEEKKLLLFWPEAAGHEIEFVLPQMLKIIHHFPDYQFVLAGVKNIPDEFY